MKLLADAFVLLVIMLATYGLAFLVGLEPAHVAAWAALGIALAMLTDKAHKRGH